jgi:signal transduction histidine kinase
MKLRHQLYLFLLFLSAVLIFTLVLNYLSYKKQYEQDIKSFIEREVVLHKKAIANSILNKNLDFQEEKDIFKKISSEALLLLKKDKTLNLQALKAALKSKYYLKNYDFELYLIDENYRVFKTTFQKDLNLDLTNISDARNLLDKSKDGNIYFSKFINNNPASMEYRLYSYSFIEENTFLELSFVNKATTNTSLDGLVKAIQTNSEINIYRVFKNEDGYSYYNLINTFFAENTENIYKSLNIINLKEKENSIVNAAINFSDFEEIKDGFNLKIMSVFDKNMQDYLGYENVVMELKIDLREKIEFISGVENLFIASLVVIIFILLLIFTFINNRFTKPIEEILKRLRESKKIDNNILKYDNELSKIAKKYNILYDNFKNEIDINISLLEENKRFIADTVHQIRTPLTNIMMNGELIKKFNNNNSLNIFLEQIDASINMLSNSYEDLSYLITSNSLEYKEKEIDFKEAIKDRIKFFKTMSKVNFKPIKDNLQSDILININDIELERLIDNNISNAIKYGFIEKDINVMLKKIGKITILEFRSYGNEIRNKQLVFKKNYREDDGKRGLGLGLFMVCNICKKYDIEYEVLYENNQNIFRYTINS